jgi:predicted RNA binding protein YcfA (HicA-like mRNA interferase family)
MASISRRKLIQRLRKFGFDGPHSGTKHQFMIKGERVVRIPNPHKNDISSSLLSEILRQAGISRREWERGK